MVHTKRAVSMVTKDQYHMKFSSGYLKTSVSLPRWEHIRPAPKTAENEVERTKNKNPKAEFPATGEASKAIFWPTLGLAEGTIMRQLRTRPQQRWFSISASLVPHRGTYRKGLFPCLPIASARGRYSPGRLPLLFSCDVYSRYVVTRPLHIKRQLSSTGGVR